MTPEARVLIRTVAVLALVALALLLVESAASLLASPVSWRQVPALDIEDARTVSAALNRNFNQLLAVVFTTVAIAVPLTANMYSVKLLELFITDRINVAVLALFVFGGLNNTWLIVTLREGFVPGLQFYLSLVLYLLCVVLLIPYLHYVFHFLHPRTLLRRLERAILADLRLAQRRPATVAGRAQEVTTAIEQIASVGIRSVDRADRSTAIESVETLRRVLQAYWRIKPHLPETWFVLGSGSFQGFSQELLDEIQREHTWVEMDVFSQLRSLLAMALPRMQDLVHAIASVTYQLGLASGAQADRPCEEVVTDYFNTFLRLALNRRETRALYTLLYRYRHYAEALLATRPDHVLQIAFYFQYYAHVARELGLPFVVETVAHDLSALVQAAWRAPVPAEVREALLERLLAFEAGLPGPPLLGVKKALAILGGFFLLHGQPAHAARLREPLASLEAATLARLRDELLRLHRPTYWEITERRLNMDYVEPPHREQVAAFLADLYGWNR